MDAERDESTPDRASEPESNTAEIEHDLRVRRALLEASRVPIAHRDRHLDALPADLVAEVRELLAYVSSDDRVEPAPDPDQWYGRRVGDWTLGVEIGAGGHGRVFKAADSQARRAAVKILHASGTDMATRLDREVAALESLDHPGIVGVLDHGVVSNADAERTIAFVAIELVDDGEPLLDWAVRVRPDRDARLDLIEQVLTALAHAHARGVVHRDLKSSNVLVDGAGVTHLIDFGIARLTDPDGAGAGLHATETRERNTIVGSLSHLAPEQVDRRLGPVVPATDVHAVGLLAYRLLCGEPPYDATGSVVQAIQAVLHVPPADPAIFDPEMPRDLADWLLACLAKDPNTRPGDAGVALSMLRAARRQPNDSPISGQAAGGGHGLRVAVVVVAITAAVIVAATAFRGGDIDNPTDPTTNQAVRQDPGAGDKEMKLRPFLSAVVGGAVVSGSLCAQDAVQWRVEDGGNGHWYRAEPTASHATGDALREHALARGADLASITSVGEDEFVESLASLATSGSAIFGGFEVSPGSFVWLDGSSFEYANWCCDQPNTSDEYDYIGYYQIGGPFPGWSDIAYADGTVTHAIVEWSADCNSDGIVDYGQILDGTFADDDGNGVPDCCEDGVPCDSAAVQWRVEDGGNGHWYEPVPFNGVVMSWEDSQTEAARRGGYLATLTTSAETAGLFDAMGSSNISAVWIGLRQDFQSPEYAEPSGGWIWVTGETLDWTNWDANEPNNSTNNEFGGEHWATLRISFGTPGRWNDYVPDYAGMAPGGYLIEWSTDCNSDGIVDYGQILDGTLLDADQDGVPDDCQTPPCPGDITGNGQVDAADLGILLAVWNTGGKSNPEADINGDGTVNAADLGLLLGNWGPCPE